MKLKAILLLISILSIQGLRAQDYANSGWHIEAKNIDPNNYFGVTLANGMIGLVSSPEPLKVKDVVLNGAFDYYGRGRVSNILKGFNFVNMVLDVDNQRLDRRNISNYKQVLDMKKASLLTTFDFQDKISVKHSLLALRQLPFSALIVVEITAKKDVEISPASVIEAPEILQDVRNSYSMIDRPHAKIPLMTSVGKTPSGKNIVAASTSFIFEEKENIPLLIHEDWDYTMHLLKFRKKLKKGETYSFAIVGSVISSQHIVDAHNEAERLTVYAALERRERLLKRHEAAWDELWKSDIIVEGDVQAQKDIRAGLYHMYAFVREGTDLSPSPMGLSGLGYNGHVFWDTELWMYPAMLMLKPEIAKSMLDYRFNRMAVARQNAFSHGYKGVMFPWESDLFGQEVTPVWALTGPFQHHITGCVGWSFWQYYRVTQDKQWLAEKGFPMLKEVSDFWLSRVEKGADGKYHINNVIGADEYAENIDDNAFTNGMAISVLRFTEQAAKILNLPVNPQWLEVANNIPIHKFADGTTRENLTYNGEIIKQADVNLLAYPLQIVSDKATIEKDLKYYEAKMDPRGPAMGPSVMSILHHRLGNADKAYELFLKSYKYNEVPPFGVIAETPGGTNPYFATGVGGMLQVLLAGYGGLDITDEGIKETPSKLPKKWKSLTITGVGGKDKTVKIQ
ncbi:MAG: glycoside hydrolase family 65 protein [Microscillaceae bacterium]|jgi:trehalose/maltose hydrolase-like predicted phosphorylase|nr:glycoside hydrolase family 65 protein [Microscillaceae bacterium]